MHDSDLLFDYTVLDAVEDATGERTDAVTLPWYPDDAGDIVADYDRIADNVPGTDDTAAVIASVDRLVDAGFLDKDPVKRPYADATDLPDRHAVRLAVTDRGYAALAAELSYDV